MFNLFNSAEKLNSKINNFRFRFRGNKFIKDSEINFPSKKEAREFLTLFLLVECVSGVNYSSNELMTTYRKLKKLVKKEPRIFSEELPVHPRKKHPMELKDVFYYINENNTVCYNKKAG